MTTGSKSMDAPSVSSGRHRGWRRLWQVPAFCAGLMCILLVAATTSLRHDSSHDFHQQLRDLRLALKGEIELPSYTSGIEPLIEFAEKFPRHQAEFHFLVGSYFYLQGAKDSRPSDWFAKAGPHLQKALALGVPEADLGFLYFRLGMTQYRLKQPTGQALMWVRQGLDLGAESPARGYAFLVEANLEMTPPNLNAALAANQKHLEYVDDRISEAIGKARYRQADILHRLGRRPEAIRELELIDPSVTPELLAQVRLLQAECAEEEGIWSQALQFWKDLEPIADRVPGGTSRVWYSQGVALVHLDPPEFEQAEQLWKKIDNDTVEGQAARLRLGQILLFGNRYDPQFALAAWTKALASVRASGDYANRYVGLADVLDVFDQACKHFMEKRDFQRSQMLAVLLSKVAPPGAAEEKIAQIHLGWAKELANKAAAKSKDGKSDETMLREARSRYQDAGDYFKQATQTREAGEKIELCWQSARSYLSALDYANAVMMLEKFITLNTDDTRLALGHYTLAETYQAQGQRPKARDHFLKCIELNTPPYVYRALSKLSQEELDAKNFEKARAILTQILNRIGPDLEREIHEKSLYQLGNLLFDLGEIDEASVRLREAWRRFPNNPLALNARERLGDHAWAKAKTIAADSSQYVTPERRPLFEAMKQKRRTFLQEAIDYYQALDRDLERQFQARKLSMAELLLWRKTLFSVGDLRIELEDYAEALNHFRTLQLRYKGHGESLIAAMQIKTCWQRLTPNSNERDLLHQVAFEVIQTALHDLESIPKEREDEVFRGGPNPFSRDQWRQFFRRWEGELQHVTLRVNPRNFAPQ